MVADGWKEEVVELCKKIVSRRSYSGEENGVAEELKAYMEANGFDQVYIDKYGNIIGKIQGKRPGKKLLFDGHIDTVPVGNESEWPHAPFAPEICDGKLYGRGTTDMKGAVAAYTVAACHFAKDCDRDFAGEIYVDGVVHEECFEGVAARSISEYVKPDYVVIGEASVSYTVPDGFLPDTCGASFRIFPRASSPVQSSPYPGASVVPEYCRATYDRRLLVGETKESVLAPIQKLLDEKMKEDPELKAKVSYAYGKEKCYTGETIEGERFFPGWLFEENADYVQAVKKELEDMGFTPKITKYNFCTNGSHYAGEAGIKTIGMGPSVESLAHTVDEYCTVEALEKVAGCYYGIMKALLK